MLPVCNSKAVQDLEPGLQPPQQFSLVVLRSTRFVFKDTTITKIDWLYFSGALVSLVLWLVIKNPTLAIIFVVLTDGFAFASTFHKSWSAPYDETLSVYYLSALKFTISICAMSTINFVTIFDPLYLVIANVSFTIFTLWRRNVIAKTLLEK